MVDDAAEPVSDSRFVTIVVPAALRPLLYGRRRGSRLRVVNDGVSTIGHVVGSLGVPLTEIGALLVGGEPVGPG